MEKISIIIPCYNTEKYIKETLNSVLEQTYKNLEVICVDDGSTDNTNLILKSVKDDRIKIIEQKNMGNSRARETGCKSATGSLIIFIDSDDLLFNKETIEYMVGKHKNNNYKCTGFTFKPFYDAWTFKTFIKYSVFNSFRRLFWFKAKKPLFYNWYLWAKVFDIEVIKNSKWSDLNRAVDKQFFIDNKISVKMHWKKVIKYRVRKGSVMKHTAKV